MAIYDPKMGKCSNQVQHIHDTQLDPWSAFSLKLFIISRILATKYDTKHPAPDSGTEWIVICCPDT